MPSVWAVPTLSLACALLAPASLGRNGARITFPAVIVAGIFHLAYGVRRMAPSLVRIEKGMITLGRFNRAVCDALEAEVKGAPASEPEGAAASSVPQSEPRSTCG
jgi:hypothetical protein